MYLTIHDIFNLSLTHNLNHNFMIHPNITIYHTNLMNLVQNTNELYKNVSHNMGSKIFKQFHIIISKLKEQNRRFKNKKSPRALNFINQFALGHQLTRQTQQSRNYNRKGRITI